MLCKVKYYAKLENGFQILVSNSHCVHKSNLRQGAKPKRQTISFVWRILKYKFACFFENEHTWCIVSNHQRPISDQKHITLPANIISGYSFIANTLCSTADNSDWWYDFFLCLPYFKCRAKLFFIDRGSSFTFN